MPLHAVMEVKGDRGAPVADVPGLRQFGEDVQGQRIIRAGADQAVVGRGDRRVDAPKGGLVHVVEGDLLVARAKKFAAIPGLVAVGRGQRDSPFASQLGIGLARLLGQREQRDAEHQEHADPPWPPEGLARRHTSTSLVVTVPSCPSPSLAAWLLAP